MRYNTPKLHRGETKLDIQALRKIAEVARKVKDRRRATDRPEPATGLDSGNGKPPDGRHFKPNRSPNSDRKKNQEEDKKR
jgi:hypothetical protein